MNIWLDNKKTSWETIEKFITPPSYHLIPPILGEVSRHFYIHRSIMTGGRHDILFIIRIGEESHSAIEEDVSLFTMSDLERSIMDLMNKMKSLLRPMGFLPYEKKPEPEPLPDWMVKP